MMRTTIFLLLAGVSLYATPPTVSQVSVSDVSHSDMLVYFHVDGATHQEYDRFSGSNIPVKWDYLRFRYTFGTSCASGVGGQVQYTTYNHGDGTTARNRMGGDAESANGTFRAILSGIVVTGTDRVVHVCPEVAIDDMGSQANASEWSAGPEIQVTLPPVDKIHPAYPELPRVSGTPQRPDITGFTVVDVACDSSALQAAYNDARANSLTNGTIIQVPAGSNCSPQLYPTAPWPDSTKVNGSSFGNSNGLLTFTANEPFNEGQGIVFDVNGYSTWLPNSPSGSCDGINRGKPYYAHFSNLTSGTTMFLTCDKTFSDAGQLVKFNGGGGGPHILYAKYPRVAKPIIIRTNTSTAQFAATNTRVGPQWLPKMATWQHQGNDNMSTFFATNTESDNIGYLATNVWVEGIRFLALNNTDKIDFQTGPNLPGFNHDPGTGWISLSAGSSNIIFSQNLFQGLGHPNSLYTISLNFNGTGNGFINNYFSDLTDYAYAEGTQALVSGKGPGPMFFVGNKLERFAGNIMHYDEGGGVKNPRNDYYVVRNWFRGDFSLAKGLLPTGNQTIDYGSRQPLEWKGGGRILVEGNLFDQVWFHHATAPVLFTSVATFGKDSYGIHDVTLRYNTFEHTFGGTQMGGSTQGGGLQTAPVNRFNVHDNLFWDIKGYYAADPSNGQTNILASPNQNKRVYQGSIILSLGDGEDQRFNHNTVWDIDGTVGDIIRGSSYAEGVEIKDNFLYIPGQFTNNGPNYNHGFSRESYGIVPDQDPCKLKVGEGYLACVYRNITIAGNVLYSDTFSYNQLKGIGQSTPTDWFTGSGWRVLSTPNAFNTIGWKKTPAPSFLNFDFPKLDFQLKNVSEFMSGGAFKGSDGRTVGADMNALRDAQGFVTFNGVNNIGTTSATISYVAPDSQSCSIDLSTTDPNVINSFNRNEVGGTSKYRNAVIVGLAAHTTYYGRVNCQVDQPLFSFRTK